MLPILPTRIHGILDYTIGLALLVLPLLLWPGELSAASVPMALGGGMLVVSLCTDYELGVKRILPMPAHLIIDMIAGATLVFYGMSAGPSSNVGSTGFMPLAAIGFLEIVTAFITQTTPRDRTIPRA